jgi:hypothetical protein
MESQKIHLDVDQINADPSVLNGRVISGGYHTGLHIKNVTLKKTVFKDIDLRETVFENVIFEDCDFINVYSFDMKINNVLFKRGRMIKRIGLDKNADVRSQFNSVHLENVIFDATKFDGFRIQGASRGPVWFMNITDISGIESSLINGRNLWIRIDNCVRKNAQFVSNHGDATIYATNSTFENSGFAGSGASVIYAQNCIFVRSHFGNAKILVVRDSKASGPVQSRGTAYFVDNEYIGQISMRGETNSRFFVVNRQMAKGKLNLLGGEFFIYNTEILNGVLHQTFDKPPYITSFNIKNVIIREGGNWKDLILHRGQWENVQIYPPVNVENAKIEGVRAYNLTFPKGNPWTGQIASGKITESDAPFTWPEIHVPTPEELGLVKEYPPITGGER